MSQLTEQRFAQIVRAVETWRPIDPDTLEPIEVARNEFAMAKQFLSEMVQAMLEANAGPESPPAPAPDLSVADGMERALLYQARRADDAEHESAREQAVAFAREAIDAHQRTADTLDKINGDLLSTLEISSRTIQQQAASIAEFSSINMANRIEELRRFHAELSQTLQTARAALNEQVDAIPTAVRLDALERLVVAWLADMETVAGVGGLSAVETPPWASSTDALVRESVKIRARRLSDGV